MAEQCPSGSRNGKRGRLLLDVSVMARRNLPAIRLHSCPSSAPHRHSDKYSARPATYHSKYRRPCAITAADRRDGRRSFARTAITAVGGRGWRYCAAPPGPMSRVAAPRRDVAVPEGGRVVDSPSPPSVRPGFSSNRHIAFDPSLP
jgi:hypothetical protein